MPRRKNPQDLNFEIHVDPSCLSEPMEEKNETHMADESGVSRPEPTQSPTADAPEHSSEETTILEPQTNKDLLDDISALAEEYASTAHHEVESETEDHHEASVLSRGDESDYGDGHTDASVSRRESAVSSVADSPARRASGRTEALIHAAARDIVAHINDHQGHGRESLQSTSIAEEDSYISNSQLSSARQSDAHESVADSWTVHSRPASARQSDFHEQQPGEDSFISHSQPGSARQSDAHESVDDNWTVHSQPASARQSDVHEPAEDSYISQSQPTSARQSDAHETVEEEHHAPADEDTPIPSVEEDTVPPVEDAGDSSSHHENDDDVFSDHSPRSSVGSLSEGDQKKMDDALSRMTRSPRISDVSRYEDNDEEENFVPTVRGTPRPPFRSPSSVKAMQMSSPPASVFGSPRSSRRTPLPTVSRLGSPSVSAQFSPKRTPPRFRRNTPPLVLLHATLLPLRWAWGDVLDNAQTEDLSQSGKTLRDSWRQLQDRVGETVSERGILLPHPQNDYEVLEERLLEALELPLRRRARILECGHYLGAANEMTLPEELESEDEDGAYYEGARSSRASFERKTHWCTTCRSEIRYDSLGAGKVFRVKIYASNGLMKAGAWEACWKEMERVDIELEPLVEPDVQEELDHLAAEQERALELQEAAEEAHRDEPEESFMQDQPSILPSSPVPEIRVDSSPPFDERRLREEERLREIYGASPPTQPETTLPTEPPASDYIPQETPPSPSVEAFERREQRREQTHKTASLPELLLEAVRVLMQDRKNVAIVLLSVLIMALAVRGGGPDHDPKTYQTIVKGDGVPTVTVTQGLAQETNSVSTAAWESTSVADAATASTDPCVSQSGQSVSDVSPEVVRVVQTITETAVETATVRVTATETYTEVEPEATMPAPVQAEAEEVGVTEEDEVVEEAADTDLVEEVEEVGEVDEGEIEREL